MPCIVRSITADAVLVKRSTVGAPHQTAEPLDRKWAKKISTRRLAREWLIAHPEACRVIPVSGKTSIPKGGEKKHEHGSVTCVSAFLGPL